MLISLIKQATIEKLNTKERMKVYESSYMIHKENIPESSYFTNIVSAVPKRDKIRITLSNESDDLFISIIMFMMLKNTKNLWMGYWMMKF